jgi:hypothetical protein
MKFMIFSVAAFVVSALLPSPFGAASAAKPEKRQAGSWVMSREPTMFEGTGLTGDMAEMAKAGKSMVGVKDVSDPVCLKAVTTAKDSLKTRLNEAIQFGPEWRIVRSAIVKGKVDFAATMDVPDQGMAVMKITGTITAKTTDLLLVTDSHMPAPGKGHIHTEARTANKWVGKCTADQMEMN